MRVYHISPLTFYLTKGYFAFGNQDLKVLLDNIALVVGVVEDEDVVHTLPLNLAYNRGMIILI